MKRTSLFVALILLSTIFVAPAKAGSTPAGTVIRCNRSYRADYVATDGKRYPFANAYVYYTWYYNLAPVKVIPCADFDRIPEGGGQITARPGAKLVKFDGSNDLYVVTVGAVLRKLPNTDMAKTYYGNYHAYYTITLPQINKSSYRIGEPITDVAQFSRGEEMLKTATIDQELVFRGLISVPVPTPTQTPTPTPTPVALSTDATLSLLALNTGTPLSPVFNAATTRYTVTVPNNQTQFIVSAKTNHPRATLRVNEGLFANGQGSVTQSLLVGANISTIIVTAEDRVTQKVYYITTTREAAPTPPSPAPTPAPTPSPTPTTPPTPAPQPSAGSLTLSTIITEATFNAMFPNRSYSGCNGSVFTYASFIEAARSYPRFASEGSDDVRKREVAAFLAQISHETTGGWATAPGGPYAWGLCFREEVGCERGGCAAYCDPSNSKYQCVAGKNYHGRGPMQLSWNYNYGAAGEALGLNLLQNPDQVATNGTVAFKTALWFWMTAQPPKPSAHDVMTGAWTPSAQDVTAGRLAGYGMTTNIINGGLECQQSTDARVRDRVGFFQTYAQRLNVTTGNNLYCDQMKHY